MGFNKLDTSKTLLNGKEIQNAEEYTYLVGTTFSSNGNFQPQNNDQ